MIVIHMGMVKWARCGEVNNSVTGAITLKRKQLQYNRNNYIITETITL